MAQIFPKWFNRIPFLVALAGGPVTVILIGAVWYYGSPEFTDVGYRPKQPVFYSHKLHVGDLGMDCRYCHSSVETAAAAVIPPTNTCMNCHRLIKTDSPLLAPLHASASSGKPMRWVRVHDLPDYVYFDHSAHVNAGVGCVSCHGRIDTMEVVRQEKPLSMGWCLDCHREPDANLRPVSEVTNMEWRPGKDHAEFVQQWKQEKGIHPPVDCTGCHR